jgi:hypothetical protein
VRKIAVELQSGLRMTAFTSFVTYASRDETRLGGCTLTRSFGATHATAGNSPRRAAVKKSRSGAMSWSCPPARTVAKYGSGFQIPGVFESCRTGAQTFESSAQSGCVARISRTTR